MKRVLVCGGRNFHGDGLVWRALDCVRFLTSKEMVLIHGGAKGADHYAARWAKYWAVPTCVFEPDWGKYRLAAGPIRNQKMLEEGKPDMVIAFPGGRGTADMVRRAKHKGVMVFELGNTEATDSANRLQTGTAETPEGGAK